MSEVLKVINDKNHFSIRSCLAITMVSVAAWLTKLVLLKKKNNKEQNNYSQQYENEKITTPLIVVTGCDTGLGYSVVMRYLNGGHCNENLNNVHSYNFRIFKPKKLIIPSNFAIVAFCLNPNGVGAKCLLQQSLKSKNINLFIRRLDLTDKDSINDGVAFVSDLLEQNVEENRVNNEKDCFKYSKYKMS